MSVSGVTAVVLAGAGMAATLAVAETAPPKQLWEVTGLENPESALPDVSSGTIYVSNVSGEALDKNGNGFISKVAMDGTLTTLKWVEGLNAPKGLAIAGGKLYTADIDALVVIDIASGKIETSYPAQDAVFLNDIAADADGAIYVSDMATNKIWRLSGGAFEVFLDDPALNNPNGLLVEDDTLLVASWGPLSGDEANTVNGTMVSVDLKTKKITKVEGDTPEGNLDGLEPLGDGTYVVSDWVAGKVYTFGAGQKPETILTLEQGAADVGYEAESKTLYVPRMMQNTVRAYQMP